MYNSPAVDKGIQINSFNTDIRGVQRPQDNAWDIGAFEFSKSQSALHK